MLYNIVLVPLEILMILMIYKVTKDTTKLYSEQEVNRDDLNFYYDLDKEFIQDHNRRYVIPPIKMNLFIFIIMSISTIIFDQELYDLVITNGFIIYLSINLLYLVLGKVNLNKRKVQK